MKYAKASKEIVLPDGLGLNRCSNNRSKTPSPDPGLGFPMCFPIYILARDAIRRKSMGKLIWSLAEAKLRIMRAAVDTHSPAFLQLGENMKDLEDLVRRPDHPGSKSFPLLFSPAKKESAKKFEGNSHFPAPAIR